MDIYDPESPTVEMGEIFGKYELLQCLATGGMAEIFRAAMIGVGGFRKLVALKRILPHLSEDAEFVSLFISEAKLVVGLNHGNIVGVLDFGRVDKSYYLTMDLVEGQDLTRLLVKQSQRERSMPIEVACYVIAESLLGLEYAHTRRDEAGRPLGIVHRDISPHNVLVSYDGEVKLTDFGIAKARTRMSLSKPGTILGKFAYMSPEQAHGLELDGRSDLYSAAVTLYEALTGRRLFFHEDPVRTLARVREPRVDPPSRYNADVPPELDQIVMTALERDPYRRYQSAREMRNALQSILQNLAPEFDDSHLVRYMKQLFADEVGPERFVMAAARPAPTTGRLSTLPAPADPLTAALLERFEAEPNLWGLVDLGERCAAAGARDDALRCFRVAATRFAQNGLLVQAMAALVKVRDAVGWSPDLAREIASLRELPGRANREVLARLSPLGGDRIGRALAGLFEGAEPPGMATMIRSPIFSLLDPEEFANLASLLKLRRVPPGTAIIREGDVGTALYILARGRVMIFCVSYLGRKVYLSSLTDGDCVGEFSFFTGEPRAATVETMDEAVLFEIEQRDLDRILLDFPSLTETLLRFYKERVVAILLAKSELFGVLDAKLRASLAERLEPVSHTDEWIIREGERSDGFYLIKSGVVDVYCDGRTFLRKLGSGDFFGEIAAIKGTPRTASVRAAGPVELLRLSGDQLVELASRDPELMRALGERIAEREAETARARTAGGRLV